MVHQSKSQFAYAKGLLVEQKVARYLQAKGLTLVTQNFKAKCGEIDLVMRDKATWVFVEVKYRADSSRGTALEQFTAQKRRKLTAAMYVFMAKYKLDPNHIEHRIDLVAIDGNKAQWLTSI